MALIQTRVSTKIDKWVKKQAKQAELSVAAWLRNRLVILKEETERAAAVVTVAGLLDEEESE